MTVSPLLLSKLSFWQFCLSSSSTCFFNAPSMHQRYHYIQALPPRLYRQSTVYCRVSAVWWRRIQRYLVNAPIHQGSFGCQCWVFLLCRSDCGSMPWCSFTLFFRVLHKLHCITLYYTHIFFIYPLFFLSFWYLKYWKCRSCIIFISK